MPDGGGVRVQTRSVDRNRPKGIRFRVRFRWDGTGRRRGGPIGRGFRRRSKVSLRIRGTRACPRFVTPSLRHPVAFLGAGFQTPTLRSRTEGGRGVFSFGSTGAPGFTPGFGLGFRPIGWGGLKGEKGRFTGSRTTGSGGVEDPAERMRQSTWGAMASAMTMAAHAKVGSAKGSLRPSRRVTRVRGRVAVRAGAEGTMEETRANVESRGPDLFNRTYYPKAADHKNECKPWYIVDAEGQTLGRMAVLIATVLRGKNLPSYTPSADMGSYVVVINAEKVEVSGKKETQKLYRRHTTGRPGSMKVETFQQLQKRIPERIVEKAVKGMLPKGPLGRELFRHLKVYDGPNHPHEAQQPKDITDQINAKVHH